MRLRAWRWLRWAPAVVLALLSVALMPSLAIGPTGCSAFVMADVDEVHQIGHSWFPPRVDCAFTFQGSAWVEHQPVWAFLFPIALVAGALACAWFAARHGSLSAPPTRSRWRGALAASAFALLVFATPLGLLGMAWRDGVLAILPLLTVPVLAVWTLSSCWRAFAARPPTGAKPPLFVPTRAWP